MAVIKIMNWNIENFSFAKANRGNMCDLIARVVIEQEIDILVIVELSWGQANQTLQLLRNAINRRLGGNHPMYHAVSQRTVDECYGFLVINTGHIQPVFPVLAGQGQPAPGGGYLGGIGSEQDPLTNLTANQFRFASNNSHNLGIFPLVDILAKPLFPRAARGNVHMGGQRLSLAGYGLGQGYRLPAMGLFKVNLGAGDFLLPIVVGHYASGQANITSAQVMNLRYLHIAELFSSGGHIVVDNNNTPVTDLILTGDFNLDFLLYNSVPATPTERLIYQAYSPLTKTKAFGGSRVPNPVSPGTKDPFRGDDVPTYTGECVTIPAGVLRDYTLDLKVAITNERTIMSTFSDFHRTGDLYTACFDNFFFGGTHMTNNHLFFDRNNNAGNVVLIPEDIVNAETTPHDEELRVAPAMLDYLIDNPRGENYKQVANGWTLYSAPDIEPFPPLTQLDRLIGARLISDHLPVVLTIHN